MHSELRFLQSGADYVLLWEGLFLGVSTRPKANTRNAMLQSVRSRGALTVAGSGLLDEVPEAAEGRTHLLGQGPAPSPALLNKQILGELLKSWVTKENHISGTGKAAGPAEERTP